MTPPKKKSRSATFTSKARPLPEPTKEQLAGLLIKQGCITPERQLVQVFFEIEKALGFYADGQLHIDNVPRPADIQRKFNPILSHISTVQNRLAALDEYEKKAFEGQGGELAGLVEALQRAGTACKQILNPAGGVKRPGAPEHLAQKHVIGMLRGIFWNQLSIPVNDAHARSCEFKFLKIILLASRILRIKDATKDAARAAENTARNFDYKLRRLLKDPQAQPRGGHKARQIAITAIVPARDIPWSFPAHKRGK